MASPLPPISQADCDVLIRQVKSASLLNRQLSSICQVNGLKSTGIKADLQSRITSLILETFTANDAARFQQVRQSISNAQAQRSSPSKGTPSRMTSSVQSHQLPTPTLNYSTHAMPSYSPSNGLSRNFSTSSSNGIGPDMSFPTLAFAPSPFYRVETALTGVKACEIMSQHRNTVTFNLKASDHRALDKCIADSKTWRIMVFCAGEPNGVQQIAFPHQAELRVNSGDIKANLRGLKNKPGSTRPVDITDAIRLKQGNYMNSIDFTYALTSKKFYIVLNLCRVTLVDDLVTTISTRRRIPKDSVIMELNKKAQDPDVVATSQVLSLKCPLSYSRLATPCRSMSCTHIQCFDATSYLQLQQQGPQWLCPICNKSAPFEQLAVDDYVKDILDNTPKDLETVTIEPNGRWLMKGPDEGHSGGGGSNDVSFGDDDDFEISEISVVGGRRHETPIQPTPALSTPASSGRDSVSAGPRGMASISHKRPAQAVVDLTLSSDEDESDVPVHRPAKRQATSSNGVRDSTGAAHYSDTYHTYFDR